VAVSTANPYSFTVTGNVALVANFEPVSSSETFTVNVNVNNSEYGSALGGGAYDVNATVTVGAIAISGYRFVNWTKNGAEVSTANPYSFTVTENVDLVANFEKITYTVNAGVDNSESGSASGGGTYDINATATVTATANSGYRFVNWTKDGTAVSTDNPYSFTVTEDVDLVACFEADEVISLLDFDTYAVSMWDNTFMLQLKRLADEGYSVTGCTWYKDGVPVGEGFTYSAGPKSTDKLEAGAVYTFELNTGSHGVLYSTGKVITLQPGEVMKVYPNPLMSGHTLTIEGVAEGSPVEVYSQSGMRISRTIAAGGVTTLTLRGPAGVYIVRTNNGEQKVVITN
jgi:hypothetical protein